MNPFYSFLSVCVIVLSVLFTLGCSNAPRKIPVDDCSSISIQNSSVSSRPVINHKSNDYPSLEPVLFVPGLGFGFGNEPVCKDYNEWDELHGLFEKHGYKLKIACIPQKGSIKDLASKLYCEVNRNYPLAENKKFHIIAKSMGGLAVRQMLFENSMSDRVLSVTTIATPHKGSQIADLLMSGEKCTTIGKTLLSIYNIFGEGDRELKDAGTDLSLKQMENFNKKYKRDPNIPFFSFGYKIECEDLLCKLGAMFLPFYPSNFILNCWHDEILSKGGGENDGLVPVKSAQFGKYLGTFEGDHFATTTEHSYYKGKSIWREVFEKVIVNLNRQRAERRDSTYK